MTTLNLNDVLQYIEKNISIFDQKRIASINNLKLQKVLARKNLYLFKAKNMLTSKQIVRGLVDAHISSNEETIFGNWLEGLVIFINKKDYGGWKSGIKGVDLAFNKDDRRYIVNIKSGPNWGNSSQQHKMVEDFKTAKKTLKTGGANLHVVAVNGCCYGKHNVDKGHSIKLCGQAFWEFISGERDLYLKIIESLGHRAKLKNEAFAVAYAQVVEI